MIATIVIWFGQLIYAMIKFMLDFFVFLASVTFSGVEGAPWWVNLVLYLPIATATVIIIYRLIRKGDSTDA